MTRKKCLNVSDAVGRRSLARAVPVIDSRHKSLIGPGALKNQLPVL